MDPQKCPALTEPDFSSLFNCQQWTLGGADAADDVRLQMDLGGTSSVGHGHGGGPYLFLTAYAEDPKIEPSSTQEPRREGAAEGNLVKDATRAQDEAEVRKKVNHEVIVPDEKTCRAGDVPTKRPPTTMSEKRTKSVAQTEHCVVPELAKHQQRTEERDNDLPVSNVSMVAETPSTKPSSETARRKKK
ncbi:hypothetical protein MTO96_003634 [Rhipicephalus appendiculatus]